MGITQNILYNKVGAKMSLRVLVKEEMRDIAMRKDYLIGVATVAQQEQRIRLEYYLVEETRDVSGISLYGMMIKKEMRTEGKIERTQASGKAISYSRSISTSGNLQSRLCPREILYLPDRLSLKRMVLYLQILSVPALEK